MLHVIEVYSRLTGDLVGYVGQGKRLAGDLDDTDIRRFPDRTTARQFAEVGIPSGWRFHAARPVSIETAEIRAEAERELVRARLATEAGGLVGAMCMGVEA